MASLQNNSPLTCPRDVVETARIYADNIRDGAARRDHDRTIPYAEMAKFAASGLLAAAVPARFGGPEANARALAEAVRVIAAADPGIAIIPQSHFNLAEAANRSHQAPEFQNFVFNEMLAGHLFGNAATERETPRRMQITARLNRKVDGTIRLNGKKFYATGSLFAKWIMVVAKDDDNELVVCLVERDGPGVEVLEDWDAVGQRSAACGSVIFANAPVVERFTHAFTTEPSATVPWAQIHFAAVQTGIARGALDDLIAFATGSARPPLDSPCEKVSEEPDVIAKIGWLGCQVEAAEAYLERAALLTDTARSRHGTERLTAARMAVAGAKTFATDVAIKVSAAIMEIGGTRSAIGDLALDRHWRNAQVQATHNPDRWLRYHIGNLMLNGVDLPKNGKI